MKTFESILVSNGFKKCKKHHIGIFPYKKDDIYAEVYKENGMRQESCWVVGGGMKDSQSHPGWNYSQPDKLEDELTK